MNQQKKTVSEKIQPTQNNWCSFWKILEKVNVPNQHAILRESVDSQHVSHVFIDHLYPPKYTIVFYPLWLEILKTSLDVFWSCFFFRNSLISWLMMVSCLRWGGSFKLTLLPLLFSIVLISVLIFFILVHQFWFLSVLIYFIFGDAFIFIFEWV